MELLRVYGATPFGKLRVWTATACCLTHRSKPSTFFGTDPTGCDFVRGTKIVAKPQVAQQRQLSEMQVLLLQSLARQWHSPMTTTATRPAIGLSKKFKCCADNKPVSTTLSGMINSLLPLVNNFKSPKRGGPWSFRPLIVFWWPCVPRWLPSRPLIVFWWHCIWLSSSLRPLIVFWLQSVPLGWSSRPLIVFWWDCVPRWWSSRPLIVFWWLVMALRARQWYSDGTVFDFCGLPAR